MSVFKKAERRQAKLKLAISGPSGSGKTMSALRLAVAIGGKIAVIDSENGSASLYADRFEFDTLPLEPPFTAEKYVAAIEAAEKEGYDIIIVDSFSHAWAGEGGTLDKKSTLDARGGNNFSNWRNPKQDYAKIKNALLHSSCHVIATIRSKQAYAITDDNGKSSVRRLGMDPIAEPGIEYEFTVMFEVAIDHNAQATKDRTSLFNNQVFLITEDTGKRLTQWLSEAKAAEPTLPPAAQAPAAPPPVQSGNATQPNPPQKLTLPQINRLFAIARASGWASDELRDYLGTEFGIQSTSELTRKQYDHVCRHMELNPKENERPSGDAGDFSESSGSHVRTGT